MARQITSGGITKVGIGAITQIFAEGLNQVGTEAGVLGVIGEADGGIPGATSGVVFVSDPARATSLFRSGPIVDAIRLAFQPSGDPIVPGGATQVAIFKTNASTQSKVFLPSSSVNAVTTTASAGSTTTAVNVAATLVASAMVDRWVDITIASLSATFRRRIVSNTTSAITVTPALPTAPAAADVVAIRSSLIQVLSRDFGLHTTTNTIDLNYDSSTEAYQVVTGFQGQSQVSPLLGGITRNYLHVVYTGGTTDVSTTATSGSTVSSINVAATLVNAAHANKTFVLKDSSGVLKAISKITTNSTSAITLAVNLSAVPVVGDIIEIHGVTNAVAAFSGASGVATSFTSTITGVTGDNLSISLTSGMTVNQLASSINQNTNYIATVPSGINGDTSLAQAFDFGTGTSINIQRSFSGTVSTTGFRQNIQEVVSWINTNAQYLSASRATADASDGGQLNTSSYDPPYTLYGGTRGVSANSDFQAGFDAMLKQVVKQVVPLIDQDLTNEGNGSTATWSSVSQQLMDHVVHARGSAGVERGSFIGYRGAKSAIISAALSMNDQDVQITCQGVNIVDASGNLVAKGPRELAVMAAGMRLGVQSIGEPLTKKYLRTSGVIQLDSSWDPNSETDKADLIKAGVLFAQNVTGKGTRWNRDLTTWVKDDNLAFTDGSVRDVVRYIAYDLRTQLEDRFIGRKATPASIGAVKAAATTFLESYRSDELIVDSTDPATGQVVKAYHNLKVTSTGDVVQMNVGIFPVPGINFMITNIYLSLPTQSA